jgi:hypothetical protein
MMMAPTNLATSDPVVGTFNNSSKGVDYSKYSSQGQVLTGIKVHWNSQCITGLQLAYNGNPCEPVFGNQDDDSCETNIFSLLEGDVILEVYGRFSNVLNCFAFRTLKGQSRVWGNPTLGSAFTFKGPSSYIHGLKVRAGDVVEYLEPVYGDATYLFAKPWPFMNGTKISENVGFNVSGSEEFDDGDWINDKFNYRISKLSIWSSPTFVTGIQLHYEIDGTTKSPGMHVCDNDGDKKVFLTLDNDEILERVSAKSTPEGITYVCFTTNKGKTLEGGNKASKGDHHIAKVPENQQVVALRGELKGEVLTKIGFHYNEWY